MAIDWNNAGPIEVENETRKRLGKLHVYEPDAGPFYTADIGAVLRDVLPKVQEFYPKVYEIKVEIFPDGSGGLAFYDEPSGIADDQAFWSTLPEMPLAICRAFCNMKEQPNDAGEGNAQQR